MVRISYRLYTSAISERHTLRTKNFENSLFRPVHSQTIFKYRESLTTRVFVGLSVCSMNERGRNTRALINMLSSAYKK